MNSPTDPEQYLDRVNRHLKAAGVKDACLACGSPDSIVDPSGEIGLLMMTERKLSFDRAMETVAVTCTRCGFVRLHSAPHLFGDEQ